MTRLRRSRVAPRVLWLAAQATAPVSARLSGAASAVLWFVPWQRRPTDPDHLEVLGPAQRLAIRDGEMVVHTRGEGPTVLLVHGWADRATSMAPLVPPLVAAGRRVVTVDLPAHGDAPGRRTDGPQLARVIDGLIDRYEVDAVVAHSLGALATARALRQPSSERVRRVAFVAPLVRIDQALVSFGAELRLPQRTLRGLERHMERRFGPHIWDEFAADRHPLRGTAAGLIVHDSGDRRIGIEHARRLHEAWPGSRMLETDRLGHNRILRDPGVVDAVVAHVTEASSDRSVA